MLKSFFPILWYEGSWIPFLLKCWLLITWASNPRAEKNSEETDFGDDAREMMASRNTEKMQFLVLDMLRKEQEEKKNISLQKDDFSEVVQEDFRKYRLINISSG